MKRKDKINGVKRYIIANTGIPLISWDGVGNRLTAPFPFGFTVSTDSTGWRFFDSVESCETDKVDVAIRYDSYIDDLDRAVVGMPLSTFVKLLRTYYESERDRVDQQTQGE